ncbi:hypothetical protein WN944_006020 [Citrus x changshan-huyou]|uniref:Uncharacterized protein n=1 Tax=Citrus x changshan-huyou TaxID=2935761 RepID=A0AAP0QTE1_9ROSI
MTTTNGVASWRSTVLIYRRLTLKKFMSRQLNDRKVIERLPTISSSTAVDSGGAERSANGFDVLELDLIVRDYCMP